MFNFYPDQNKDKYDFNFEKYLLASHKGTNRNKIYIISFKINHEILVFFIYLQVITSHR